MSKKTLILNVDYATLTMEASAKGEGLYDEERIEELMEESAENGVDTIFWRISACGKVAYPSKVMTVYDGYFTPYHGQSLVEILKRFDPLEVAANYAHQYGLKIFAWVTLFDSYYVGLEDHFFLQHPEFLMMSRKETAQEHPWRYVFRGVPCYSCPETREYRLAETKELASYPIDGIFYELGGPHDCQITLGPQPHGENNFGYNEPIVREYKKRYGVDILKEDFDVDKWAHLLGEHFTLFLKMARKELNKRAKQMYISTTLDKYLGCPMTDRIKIYNDWKGYVENKIVDAVVFRGHCFTIENPEVVDEIEKETANVQKKGCQIFAWYTLWDEQATDDHTRRIVERIRGSALDGATFHESDTLHYKKHPWTSDPNNPHAGFGWHNLKLLKS